jgi:hypothetical protein
LGAFGREIIITVFVYDMRFGLFIGFIGNPGRIGADIRDEADGPLPFNVDAFI